MITLAPHPAIRNLTQRVVMPGIVSSNLDTCNSLLVSAYVYVVAVLLAFP